MAQHIFFRTDASIHLGAGHVMRCLTLATKLRDRGSRCTFAGRICLGDLRERIQAEGFDVQDVAPSAPFAGTADWLVVDHYGLDNAWEAAARSRCGQLLVIDDVPNRPHVSDVLLDQNLGRRSQDYCSLVPPQCRLLLGPSYALIREEFVGLRPYCEARRVRAGARRILISMGGADEHNVTQSVLESLGEHLPGDLDLTVVLGGGAPWIAEVERTCKSLPWKTVLHIGARNMASLIAQADIAIGAAGTSSWERCCLGVPSIVLVLAENQRLIASALEQAGAAIRLDWSDQTLLRQQLNESLERLLGDSATLSAMSAVGFSLVDGLGSARVANAMAC